MQLHQLQEEVDLVDQARHAGVVAIPNGQGLSIIAEDDGGVGVRSTMIGALREVVVDLSSRYHERRRSSRRRRAAQWTDFRFSDALEPRLNREGS